MPRIAIIADDLTGALDAAEPFGRQGAAISVATSAAATRLLPFETAEIVSVNADTRRMTSSAAAATVDEVWRDLAEWQPDLVLKKIDSRLKGNIVAELRALLAASGRSKVLAAPAIPSMGRLTSGGSVTGFGVDQSIPFRAVQGWRHEWEVADCLSAADMKRIAERVILGGSGLVAAGASGLSEGLAELLQFSGPFLSRLSVPQRSSHARMIMAIGSRDPITLDQLGALENSGISHVVNGGEGSAARKAASLIVLTPQTRDTNPDAVACELAGRALRTALEEDVATVLLSGGDTAGAFIQQAKIDLLTPLGSLAAGMPFAEGMSGGHRFTLITKSGGFGHQRTLIEAFESWCG